MYTYICIYMYVYMYKCAINPRVRYLCPGHSNCEHGAIDRLIERRAISPDRLMPSTSVARSPPCCAQAAPSLRRERLLY